MSDNDKYWGTHGFSETPDKKGDTYSGEKHEALLPSQEDAASIAEPLPAKIGKYIIEAKLGSGGMGVVYKGHDDTLDNRSVAIKVLRYDNLIDKKQEEKRKKRFKDEAKALASLDNPHIVTVHDVSEDSNQPYIVMKYIDGQSLRNQIKAGVCPDASELDRRLDIFRDVCEAMYYAHSQGVVHRDLKPENIMLDSKGTAIIVDFGLAMSKGADRNNIGNSTKNSVTILGSFSYLSPEQAQGLTKIDHKTDIFSLGIILYELATGVNPFSVANDSSYCNNERERIASSEFEPDPPCKHNALIIPALEELIKRMLIKDRRKRIQNLSEVIEQLQAARQSASQEAMPAKLGKYEIKEKLGHSGIVTVYKGHDAIFEQNTAIYALPASSSCGEEKECFKKVAKALSTLRGNPHIAKFYDCGEDNGKFYIAMEYIEGQPLRSLLKEGELPDAQELERRLKIFAGILEGMAFAHEKGIAHLGLSPDNVKICQDESVKILGFGRAQLEKAKGEAVNSVTPYMSPEQAAGKKPDKSSDIFSLGVMLYELATGSLPFKDNSGKLENLEELKASILLGDPDEPRELNPLITPILAGLIEQMLASKRKQRITSAAEAKKLLNAVMLPDNSEDTAGAADSSKVAAAEKSAALDKAQATVPVPASAPAPVPVPAPATKPAPAFSPRFEARVGSYVTFGRYPQWHGDTPEPIEWLVLENDGKTALLLAKYGLDCQPFHGKDIDITWRDCDLRKWLNGEFLSLAFSAEEWKRIAESAIYTHDNPKYDTKGSGETSDRVFCLSIEETWQYFGNIKDNYGCTERWHSDAMNEDLWVNRERACKPTAYALSHGAFHGKYSPQAEGKAHEWWFDNCSYWLRSPGSFANRAANVSRFGHVRRRGFCVCNACESVRPALRIKLDDTLSTAEQKNTSVTANSVARLVPEVDAKYSDSVDSKNQGKVSPSESKLDCKVGSYVTFGSYIQWYNCMPEPIEWLVLENDGKTALLLAKYGLDCQPFHGKDIDITWRDCDLRKWLNGEFLSRAFSADERKQIAESTINTGDNPKYGTKGCGDTRDKVFCLSIEEAWKYFGNVKDNYGCTEQWHSDAVDETWWVNRERACLPTAYAVSHGAWQGKKWDKVKGKASEWWFDTCWFWLRSPGGDASGAARVGNGGAVDNGGGDVDLVDGAVRPALRIIL